MKDEIGDILKDKKDVFYRIYRCHKLLYDSNDIEQQNTFDERLLFLEDGEEGKGREGRYLCRNNQGRL